MKKYTNGLFECMIQEFFGVYTFGWNRQWNGWLEKCLKPTPIIRLIRVFDDKHRASEKA